jgi:hypothetical protein
MDPELVALKAERSKLAKRMSSFAKAVHGSLVRMERRCGKASCHCQQGMKHVSWYVSLRQGGKATMVYIPAEATPELQEGIEHYQALQTLIDELSALNVKILRARMKRRG